MSDHRELIEQARSEHKLGRMGKNWPWCWSCNTKHPCLPARLAEALEQSDEWQRSVSTALRSWDAFESGQWGGDKDGWGYHFELIGFLIRHYESTKDYSSRLAAAERQRDAARERLRAVAVNHHAIFHTRAGAPASFDDCREIMCVQSRSALSDGGPEATP